MADSSINIQDHIGLAYTIARRYAPKGIPVRDSDQFSDALLGLVNASTSFNCEKHCKFSTFAYTCIVNQIRHCWRDRNKRINADYIEELEETELEKVFYENKEDPQISLEECLEDHVDDTDMDRENKSILRSHYLDGKTWQEIGDENSKTKVWAFQRGRAAIDLIRRRFFDLEED